MFKLRINLAKYTLPLNLVPAVSFAKKLVSDKFTTVALLYLLTKLCKHTGWFITACCSFENKMFFHTCLNTGLKSINR